jgi:hypothetical protein
MPNIMPVTLRGSLLGAGLGRAARFGALPLRRRCLGLDVPPDLLKNREEFRSGLPDGVQGLLDLGIQSHGVAIPFVVRESGLGKA